MIAWYVYVYTMYVLYVCKYLRVRTYKCIYTYVCLYIGMFIASVCTYIHAYTSHTVELWLSKPSEQDV